MWCQGVPGRAERHKDSVKGRRGDSGRTRAGRRPLLSLSRNGIRMRTRGSARRHRSRLAAGAGNGGGGGDDGDVALMACGPARLVINDAVD